jgi:hypothetical protein
MWRMGACGFAELWASMALTKGAIFMKLGRAPTTEMIFMVLWRDWMRVDVRIWRSMNDLPVS